MTPALAAAALWLLAATPASAADDPDLPRVSSRAVCLVLFQGECAVDPALSQHYVVSPNPMPPPEPPPPAATPTQPGGTQGGNAGSDSSSPPPPPPPPPQPAEPPPPPEKALLIEAIKDTGLAGQLTVEEAPDGSGLVLTRIKPPPKEKEKREPKPEKK